MFLHKIAEEDTGVVSRIKQYIIIVIVAFIMAFNFSNIINVGGILPGGVSGMSLLIQKIW